LVVAELQDHMAAAFHQLMELILLFLQFWQSKPLVVAAEVIMTLLEMVLQAAVVAAAVAVKHLLEDLELLAKVLLAAMLQEPQTMALVVEAALQPLVEVEQEALAALEVLAL
jgi:hypothetical protein